MVMRGSCPVKHPRVLLESMIGLSVKTTKAGPRIEYGDS